MIAWAKYEEETAMNAAHATAHLSVVGLIFIATVFVVGALLLGAIVVLLVSRKTRLPTAVVLLALPVLLLVIGFGFRLAVMAMRPTNPATATIAPITVRQAGSSIMPKAVVEKTEQQYARETAERAGAVVRATLCAVGRAMMNPERGAGRRQDRQAGSPSP